MSHLLALSLAAGLLVPSPQEPVEQAPAPSISIVVFEEKPRQFDSEDLASRIGEVLGKELSSGEGEEKPDDNYVVVRGPMALVKVDGVTVMLMTISEPLADPDKLAEDLYEGRLRHAVRIHRAGLHLQLADEPSDEQGRREALRLVAKMTAALLDDHNSLVISISTAPMLFVVDSLTRQNLLSDDPTASLQSNGENPPVIHIPDDDPELVAAVAEARRRFPEFERARDESADTDAGFSVKFELSQGEKTEHVWLTVERIAEGRIHGTIGNQPVDLAGIEMGSAFDIAVEEIEDWVYMSDGEMRGGFSVQLLYRRMEQAAAKARAERLKDQPREDADPESEPEPK